MYEENTLYPSAVNHQNNFIFRTFLWMFIGLAVTAVCAWITYESGLFWYFFYENTFTTLLVIELVVVIAFSFLFRKLPPIAVGILFFAYAVLNGVTLSVIFILYQMSSIVILFLAGAALFGGFAIYGYKTTSDMTRFGPMLMITLIIAVVISLINIFLLKSGVLEIVLDCGILFLFFGITVYDMNKIKQWSMVSGDNKKMYIYGAMQLYLDFINIFLRLLSLFGKAKR